MKENRNSLFNLTQNKKEIMKIQDQKKAEQLQTILIDLENKAITKHQAYDLILVLFDVSQQRELLITAFREADRTGYIELLTNAETIADKVISGNL